MRKNAARLLGGSVALFMVQSDQIVLSAALVTVFSVAREPNSAALIRIKMHLNAIKCSGGLIILHVTHLLCIEHNKCMQIILLWADKPGK
jgi:hypothetical protein